MLRHKWAYAVYAGIYNILITHTELYAMYQMHHRTAVTKHTVEEVSLRAGGGGEGSEEAPAEDSD